MTTVCIHGHRARSCEICERDQEIAELRTALRQAREAEAQAMALVLNHEGHIEKLRDELRSWCASFEGQGRDLLMVTTENAGLREAFHGIQKSRRRRENAPPLGPGEEYVYDLVPTGALHDVDDALQKTSPLTAAVQAVVEAARHFRQHKGHETRRGFGEIEALHAAVDHLNTLLRPAPQPQGEEDEEGQGLIQEDPE